MEIVFKNGEKIKIEQKFANILNEEYKEGAKFYFFNDENKNVRLMLNIEDISYIK